LCGVRTQPTSRRTSSTLRIAGSRASLFARRMSKRCQWRCNTCTKKKRIPQEQIRIVLADQWSTLRRRKKYPSSSSSVISSGVLW